MQKGSNFAIVSTALLIGLNIKFYEIIAKQHVYLSGFAKRYLLQDFLATVSFEACSVLDHIFSYDHVFSTKNPNKRHYTKDMSLKCC